MVLFCPPPDTLGLSGRPYGGVSFLFKKSMSPNIKLIEIGSKRVCCIGVNTDRGLVYLFNVYMPCDTNTNEHLCDYNMILTDIAKYCDDNGVLNCVIGGDMNTDMSRTKSGNTVSLRNFIRDENLNLVLNNVNNSVEYTYRGINNNVSLIDHFIVSENMRSLIEDYYTDDSSDNLSDHVPLFIKLNCAVETVPNEPASVLQSKPVWGLAKPHHINNYQVKLNELLYKFLPTDEMLLDHESLCLKQEFITEFHDSIITASHLAMQQSIPYSHQSKVKVIPGWDIDMDIARDKSMFWHGIWKDCGKMPSGVVYSIMKKTRSTYHYMLRALKKKKTL